MILVLVRDTHIISPFFCVINIDQNGVQILQLFADYHDLTKIPFIKDAIEAETNIGVKLRY